MRTIDTWLDHLQFDLMPKARPGLLLLGWAVFAALCAGIGYDLLVVAEKSVTR